MYAKKWEDFPEDDRGHAIYFGLFPKESASNLEITLARIKPGREIPIHSHENKEQVFIVLEGRGILRLGEEEQELSEKMIVHIPLRTEHSLRNMDDINELKYIYVSSYI